MQARAAANTAKADALLHNLRGELDVSTFNKAHDYFKRNSWLLVKQTKTPVLDIANEQIKDILKSLKIQPSDIERIMQSLDKVPEAAQIKYFIQSGQFNKCEGYDVLLSRIKDKALSGEVLQTMEQAALLQKSGFKNIRFEIKPQQGQLHCIYLYHWQHYYL